MVAPSTVVGVGAVAVGNTVVEADPSGSSVVEEVEVVASETSVVVVFGPPESGRRVSTRGSAR